MELFLLYVWLKLGTIHGALIGIGFLMVSYVVILLFYVDGPDTSWEDTKERRPVYYPKIKRIAAGAVCIWFVAALLPNQTQTAVLVGGHYALKVADTPEAGKIMGLLRKKANEFLDAELAKPLEQTKKKE